MQSMELQCKYRKLPDGVLTVALQFLLILLPLSLMMLLIMLCLTWTWRALTTTSGNCIWIHGYDWRRQFVQPRWYNRSSHSVVVTGAGAECKQAESDIWSHGNKFAYPLGPTRPLFRSLMIANQINQLAICCTGMGNIHNNHSISNMQLNSILPYITPSAWSSLQWYWVCSASELFHSNWFFRTLIIINNQNVYNKYRSISGVNF